VIFDPQNGQTFNTDRINVDGWCMEANLKSINVNGVPAFFNPSYGDWSYTALNVPLIPPNAVATISAGANHTLALRSDGTALGWGYNSSGQATIPTSLSGVVAISGGGLHSLALKNDGTVTGWGDN